MGNTLTFFIMTILFKNINNCKCCSRTKKARPERDGAGVSGCCLSDGRWWCITFWLYGLSIRRLEPCES